MNQESQKADMGCLLTMFIMFLLGFVLALAYQGL